MPRLPLVCRLTIALTEPQMRALDSLSEQRNLPLAIIAREAIDEYLAGHPLMPLPEALAEQRT